MDEMQPQEVGEADRLRSSGHGGDSESSNCFSPSSVRDDAPSGFLPSREEHMFVTNMVNQIGQWWCHNIYLRPLRAQNNGISCSGTDCSCSTTYYLSHGSLFSSFESCGSCWFVVCGREFLSGVTWT